MRLAQAKEAARHYSGPVVVRDVAELLGVRWIVDGDGNCADAVYDEFLEVLRTLPQEGSSQSAKRFSALREKQQVMVAAAMLTFTKRY